MQIWPARDGATPERRTGMRGCGHGHGNGSQPVSCSMPPTWMERHAAARRVGMPGHAHATACTAGTTLPRWALCCAAVLLRCCAHHYSSGPSTAWLPSNFPPLLHAGHFPAFCTAFHPPPKTTLEPWKEQKKGTCPLVRPVKLASSPAHSGGSATTTTTSLEHRLHPPSTTYRPPLTSPLAVSPRGLPCPATLAR